MSEHVEQQSADICPEMPLRPNKEELLMSPFFLNIDVLGDTTARHGAVFVISKSQIEATFRQTFTSSRNALQCHLATSPGRLNYAGLNQHTQPLFHEDRGTSWGEKAV